MRRRSPTSRAHPGRSWFELPPPSVAASLPISPCAASMVLFNLVGHELMCLATGVDSDHVPLTDAIAHVPRRPVCLGRAPLSKSQRGSRRQRARVAIGRAPGGSRLGRARTLSLVQPRRRGAAAHRRRRLARLTRPASRQCRPPALRCDSSRCRLERDLHLLKELERAIAELDCTLLRLGGGDLRVKVLVMPPGVDTSRALALLAALGDIHRFQHGS